MIKHKLDLILNTLDTMFPDAHCELNHSNEFELLVAVMLSAQTTDQSVNKLTDTLFKKYRCVEDYANASVSELENDIRTIGLYRNKAKSLHLMANKLIEEYNGEVPRTIKELVKLPGVGQKTANVVVSVAFGVPAFAVDTHVERIAKRLGFAKKEDSVQIVEKKLCKAIPKDRWIKGHHQFIFFGRYFCKATNPNCQSCSLYDICKEPLRKSRR
ncbi:MAG: endonuclease III [Erysipelotrichaceae bacterium]|nr:endonuclease III [Erysipelotrichaceae bacterium]